MRKAIYGLLLLGAMSLLLWPAVSYAGGLSTAFSRVELKNLRPGMTYSTAEAGGLPLEVKNTSDYEVELKIDVLIPKEDELKEGILPIPDASWVTVDEDHFFIEPGGTGKTDVYINIPDDIQYLGKKYGAFIWSHTIGRSIGVGLKSALLFTIVDKEEYEKGNVE